MRRKCIANKKMWLLPFAAAALSISLAAPSFAGEWKQDSIGWWYRNNDGTYPAGEWKWIDGDGDTWAESYCFDADGYMLADTVTPDGYRVNAQGAWISDDGTETVYRRRYYDAEAAGSWQGSERAASEAAGRLIGLGLVPAETAANPGAYIRWDQMAALLSNVIEYCDESCAGQWKETARNAFSRNDEMREDGGAAAIYEAACVLGLGAENRAYWHKANAAYDGISFGDYSDIFPNFYTESPGEANMGQHAGWDYSFSALLYSLGMSSSEDPAPFFGLPRGKDGFSQMLTCEKAMAAAYRLILAYQDKYEGSYTVPETDWQDPLLAGTKARVDSIVNSGSAIRRADHFVLGETYTGTAYYVSNDGDDKNDGRTPETAWASLERVEQTPLSFGDAVFFRRGDRWYGTLVMQEGVSYSAYGSGSKPIITGSPEDAGDPASWSFYGLTADGGKIWQYHEKVHDVGVMLFDEGERVGKKVYPVWNGTGYVNRSGEPFALETALCGDRMFCDLPELQGHALPASVFLLQPEGTLYLRCDAGNPGEVFDGIEMSLIENGTSAFGGYHAVDNIHFRVFSESGADCCNADHIIYQNCEISWCGGTVKTYESGQFGNGIVGVSGGGMLMFGSHVTARNNYVHDCENKGIAVVINGGYGDPGDNGHTSLERKDIHIEKNVIERCGASLYMMTEFIEPGKEFTFEDIYIEGNDVLCAGYGWRAHNMYMQGDSEGTYGTRCEAIMLSGAKPTGTVKIADNLFYKAAGPLIAFGSEASGDVIKPVMSSNIYVQSADGIFLVEEEWAAGRTSAVVTLDQPERLEACVRERLMDPNGTAVIR